MIHPTIHLNGTSREDLMREYRAAYDAVDTALEAVSKVTVHGRDYYPQGPDAYKQAREEHLQRVFKLGEIKSELTDLILGLVEQPESQTT